MIAEFAIAASLLAPRPMPDLVGHGYVPLSSNFLRFRTNYTYCVSEYERIFAWSDTNAVQNWGLKIYNARYQVWTNAWGTVWETRRMPGLLTNRSQSFCGFFPESLDHHLHTQNLVSAVGRTNWIYAIHTHTHSTGTGEFYTNPAALPLFERQSNSVIRLWRGHTGISHCNTIPGGDWGQLGVTLITRRHGYLRGHDTGRDPGKPTGHIYTNYAGYRVFFCTESNTVVSLTISNRTVRANYGDDQTDFGIVIFTEDAPDSITPVKIAKWDDLRDPLGTLARALARLPTDDAYSVPAMGSVPNVNWICSQDGSVGLNGPPSEHWLWKPPIYNPYRPRVGDSGSPVFIVYNDEIVVYTGMTSYGFDTPDLLKADINALTLSLGLDTNLYQPEYVDLTGWPTYARDP